MTILSTKKPSNGNKDSSLSQSQQQQQISTLTRSRLSYDDEHSNGMNSSANFNEDSSDGNNSIENQAISSSITTVDNQILDEIDQYNSEDEYDQSTIKSKENNSNEREINFASELKEKKGFAIKHVQEDGACLFRAVSDQVFGDEEMHSTVRQNCLDYIVKNADFFRAYITEDFDHYVTRKRQANCHGNHIEMIALSEIYNRPIEVYEYGPEPINVVHGMYRTDNEPIRLSYHRSVHYNSVIDPWKPTAGHGLGLPDLEPGHAQESLIASALRQSEESHIERTIVDDKLAATDWEATQDELIQQIAKESYLQWLYDTNQQQINNNKTTASSSSTLITSSRTSDDTETTVSENLLPLQYDEGKHCEFVLPFQYDDNALLNPDCNDDDNSLIQQVLAMSQIEYIENLRQQDLSESNNHNESSSSETNPV